jgi:drug/metabolite transporter (DMT)-like permease
VELLDYMEVPFLILCGVSILFSIVVVLIYIPTISLEGSFFPTSSPTIVVFLMIAILTGVKWSLKVVFFNFYFFIIHMCIQCVGHFSPVSSFLIILTNTKIKRLDKPYWNYRIQYVCGYKKNK